MPSEAAKSSTYRHYHKSLPIYDGQYALSSPTSTIAPPIKIFHLAFAAFLDDIAIEDLDIPNDVLTATANLMSKANTLYLMEVFSLSHKYHSVPSWPSWVNSVPSDAELISYPSQIGWAELSFANLALPVTELAELSWLITSKYRAIFQLGQLGTEYYFIILFYFIIN